MLHNFDLVVYAAKYHPTHPLANLPENKFVSAWLSKPAQLELPADHPLPDDTYAIINIIYLDYLSQYGTAVLNKT